MKEKKDRLDDALQATKAALDEGILPGAGVALLHARDVLKADLERNASRDRALPPSIVLRTWRDVNKNIETYKGAFDNNFILIDNDPEARLEYDPEYAKETFFKTVKGSGKQYSPEELVKKKAEVDALNQEISNLLKASPDFTSIEDAKSKINNFLQ